VSEYTSQCKKRRLDEMLGVFWEEWGFGRNVLNRCTI